LHVGHLDHQGFGSRIIGFGDSRNQYAVKNTPALQTTTGHFPAARRPARRRKRRATFRGKKGARQPIFDRYSQFIPLKNHYS
jgi:hypothetical protein